MPQLALAALLVTGLAAGAVSFAAAQPATPVSPASPTVTAGDLRFDVHFHDTIVARDPSAGFRLGDQIILNDELRRDGAVVGHTGGVCTVTDLAGELLCVVTFALPDGTLAAQFLNTPPPVKEFAILGGTGAYAGAHGTGTLTEFGDETGDVVFTLTD